MAATTIAPTPDTGGERPAEARAEAAALPAPVAPAKRVLWRAVVRTGGAVVGSSRERERVEWHLTQCAAPHAEANHCSMGRHLIETVGQPDGHCIIGGVCGLCGAEPPAD